MATVSEAWVQSLPKVELHAHLSGSLSSSTLLELLRGKEARGASSDWKGLRPEDLRALVSDLGSTERRMAKVFQLFRWIQVIFIS